MKKLFLALFAAVLTTGFLSPVTQATVFNVERVGTFNKRAEELKNIILDVESYCDHGCKYKLTNVREMKVVDKVDDDHIYSWVYVAAQKSSSNFNYTVVSKTDQGFTIESSFPEREKIRELREKTGLGHATMFSDITTNWTLTEKFDQKGQFLNTEASYRTVASGSGMTLRLFASLVRSGLEQTARDMMTALGQDQSQGEIGKTTVSESEEAQN